MTLSEGLKTSLLFIDVNDRLCNINDENVAQSMTERCVFACCVNAFICLCVMLLQYVYVCMSTDDR